MNIWLLDIEYVYLSNEWCLENGEEEYNGEPGDGSGVSEDAREENVEQGNEKVQ